MWQTPGPWKVVGNKELASPWHVQSPRSWAHLHMHLSQTLGSWELKLPGFPYLTGVNIADLRLTQPHPHSQ